ncbi:anti-sigma factor domain-containing protein [Rhizobium sp. TRM95796]|uniref:anti-sigma factor n=1 Tax=Rhizobium sp. TRM95796 TaxID=2979862 RepID=UPI0021E765BA|nr:anti-sigma factor [Rhizobium sp. TRM95796]MCV3764705.1 anti-sigma factor [Rhizobium sp. TRM95796]
MTYDRKDLADLADEYVLGLAESATAREIENAMERDPELKAAIALSRERFLPLDTTVTPASVNDSLWTRIESALPAQQGTSGPPVSTVANDNSSKGWKIAALSSTAAALLLAIGLGYSISRTADPIVVAVLLNEAGEVQAVIEDFGDERATVRLLADFAVPNDKTMEVWTLPSRDMGPVSLGLLEGVRSARLDGPALPTPRDNQLYEITLEQSGGSPTGRPTGPILAKGLAKLPR